MTYKIRVIKETENKVESISLYRNSFPETYEEIKFEGVMTADETVEILHRLHDLQVKKNYGNQER